MNNYQYFRPATIAEAADRLAEEPNSRVLAGGTDLIIDLRTGKVKPDQIVDLKAIPKLRVISVVSDYLRIGATVTVDEIATSAAVCQYFPVLREAALQLGSWQVRNRATIGGNIGNGAPTADMPIPLLALGAQVEVAGREGNRMVPLEDIYLGPGKIDLAPGEFITGIRIPIRSGTCCAAYRKQGRRSAMEIAIVNVAGALELTQEGKGIAGIVLAAGGVGPCPMRLRKTEEVLKEAVWPWSGDDIRAAVDTVKSEINPRTSLRASREYRLEVTGALLERIIAELVEKAEAGV